MRKATLACVLLLASSEAHALVHAETETLTLDVGGSAKLFPLLVHNPSSPISEADTDFIGFGSVRLNGLIATENSSLEAAYHVFPVVGEDVGAGGTQPTPLGGLVSPVTSLLRFEDFDRELASPGDDFVLLHNFDRFVVTVFGPGGSELRVGRQAINHGSARILPATDIFSPFSPATLDSEFKQGLDAVRVTVPFGELTEVELYGILYDSDLPDSWSRGIYLVRLRTSFPELFDLSVYAGTSYSSPTAAVDVSGDLGGVTLYGEALVRMWNEDAVLTLTGEPTDGAPIPDIDRGYDDPQLRATVGGQYFFEFDLDVIVELHWNGPGTSGRQSLLDLLDPTPEPEYQVSEIFLLGRAYLGTAWSYALTDLSRIAFSTITNLADGSTLVTPAYYWDAAENASVAIGAILPVGRRLDDDFEADEFGLYPYIINADLRWYF